MKPIIGIISRNYYSKTNKKINIVYDDIISSVIKSKGIPIGIPSKEDIYKYLDICNGFILQGGDDIDKHNLKTLKILKEKNIPVLGICLGMQEMFYKNNLIDIPNHHINSLHEININKNSLLYKIIKKDKILVNSRHKSVIINTNRLISAKNKEIIEAIEDSSKKFYLGVQWHPENLYNIDINSKKIFDYFIKICKN
ncbi:MAG: gamma-glutamyl-gamma-aminobutyrate hydrolase family protein [Bacilli bacterium]|nr:gamma-glutamyl-gamma-aminobutyrate hydrolase family protein [Bacilli bacterium]